MKVQLNEISETVGHLNLALTHNNLAQIGPATKGSNCEGMLIVPLSYKKHKIPFTISTGNVAPRSTVLACCSADNMGRFRMLEADDSL
ncbi:unnamed protein product [Gongylonema pulchrum]|uniref:Ornithine cyclodeaminase n=1 Tax=Gongylonema pulchrum TaxID=637853 RepID=A0A183EPY1_9BILA|nr:unnamed protein product [Gongylonema pulchrum]